MRQLFRRGAFTQRYLCGLLAAVMAAGPAPIVAQQAGAAPPANVDFTTPGACVVVIARPAQLLASPVLELMPLEVLQAASIKETGLDPLDMELLVLSATPPGQGPPSAAAYAEFGKAVHVQFPALEQMTQAGELHGRRYRQGSQPMAPSMYAPDDNSLLITPEMTLQQMFADGKGPVAAELAKSAAAKAQGADLYAVINLEPLRPLLAMGLMQAELPPELESLRQLPNLIKTIELRIDFSGAGPTELAATANNAADAEQFGKIFEEYKQVAFSRVHDVWTKLEASADPVEQSMGRYQRRLLKKWDEVLQLSIEGERITAFHIDPATPGAQSQLMAVAVAGVLVALLLPAVQAAREAARRNASMVNLKRIALAMHNYYNDKEAFPAQANYDDEGKPLLSWRVHLLPYLGPEGLYEKFHLDEPWDSPHNRELIAQIPDVYVDPSCPLDPAEGKTLYLAAAGEDFAFAADTETGGRSMSDITDGTSGTIMILQAGTEAAVPWTKPADFEWAENDPMKPLRSSPHPGGFLAARCDGSVFFISNDIDVDVFHALLTIGEGELVNDY